MTMRSAARRLRPARCAGNLHARPFQRYRRDRDAARWPIEFKVVLDTLGNPNPDAIAEQVAFHRQVLKLSRAVTGATNVANELATRLDSIRRALDLAPKADEAARNSSAR